MLYVFQVLRILLPCILFFTVIPSQLKSQYFSTGQDPASTRWFQLKTDRSRILFPDGSQSQAQYLAGILDLAMPAEIHTLRAKVPRMPILLHTRSAQSNGITTWAPRRIELYPCPPQDTYAEEWLEQLAVHEYRHAVQISKMNQGFTNALYYILGEQATGAVLGLFLPPWFLEGDATVTETALSSTGRGRMPSFSARLRAQLIEKGCYSFDKATLGSYKTFIPDSYELGYHLVAVSRMMFGPELWNKTVDWCAKYPFMVIPFAAAIKRQTGLTKTGLYRRTMHYLDSVWRIQSQRTTSTRFTLLTRPDPKNYTEYDHPVQMNDSVIITAKFSNEEPDRLISIDRTGKERKLVRLRSFQQESQSVSGTHIVWAENLPHIRWQNKDYAAIRVYDYEKKKTRYLTRHSRYFSPMISPDGQEVCAVHVDEQNSCRLDILDISDGAILRSFPAPHHGLILYPVWSRDESKITFTLLTPEGKSIGVMNAINGLYRTILPATLQEISGPSFFYGKYLVFTGSWSGIDNLYALDTVSGAVWQVTSAKYASGDPDFSSDMRSMIYSDLFADGLMIARMNIDTGTWIPMAQVYTISYSLASEMASQETTNIQQDALNMRLSDRLRTDSVYYPIKRYRRGLNLFLPHSWAPLSIDAGNMTIKPGVSIQSQNLLSSTFTTAGYSYDLNERTGKVYFDFRYEGWFPVIDFRYEWGKRAGWATITATGERFRFTWNKSDLNLGINLPLNLTSGAWYRYLQPEIGSNLTYSYHDASTPENFTSGWIATMNYRIQFSNSIRSNYQDVYPQWGQTIDLQYRHAPFGGNDPGSILSGEVNLNFPGILRHNGIMVYGGYQKRWYQQVYGYTYPNMIQYPRGITNAFDEDLISLSANYKFPFLRIDLSIGSVLYIKRFKMNMYYDWAEGWGTGYRHHYQSTGLELTSDLHVLRFYAPIELGVRSYYLPDQNLIGFEFLWGLSFQ
jgi:hypothetical protein